MEPSSKAHIPAPSGAVDSATLYLCRQGSRWVVVIESPGHTGAVAFHPRGADANDARFELLARTHRACPDAEVSSTDGALESADYEWRLDVQGRESAAGHLGHALHRELSAEPPRRGHAPHPTTGRRCPWGWTPRFSGRPRSF
jgi:hypothetical protein